MPELAGALQQAALRDVHSSWLPMLTPSLLARAKQSAFGRRWLSTRLSAQTLFRTPSVMLDIPDALLQEQAWWQVSLCEHREHLIEMGAHACLSVLRTAIAREQVMQWRRVLGMPRYMQLLQLSDPGERAPLSWPTRVMNDQALIEHLEKVACFELLNYSRQCHPLLAQRVALAFPLDWSVSLEYVGYSSVLNTDALAIMTRQWTH